MNDARAPAARLEVQGWSWEDNPYRLSRSKDGSMRPVLRFNVEPVALEKEESGRVHVVVVKRTTRTETEELRIPASVISVTSPSQELARTMDWHIPPDEARTLRDFLYDCTAVGEGIPVRQTVLRPHWQGDELIVPGKLQASARAPEVARYGVRASIEETAARDAWVKIVEIAVEHPKLLVLLGTPFASIYASKLDAELFVTHVTGDSSTGKTMLSGAAMATVGNPSERARPSVYQTWNMSAQAPGALLKQMGVLPVWLDETKTNQREAAETASMVFSIVQGQERLRANQSGGLDIRERWDCVVLSTGEARLSNVSAEQGLRKRVLEISAPLTDEEDAHRIKALTDRAFGWPLWWLAESPDAEWAHRLMNTLYQPHDAPGATANIFPAVTEHVALSVVGFATLARLVGVDLAGDRLPELEAAVSTVAIETAASLAGEGLNIGARLHRAVFDAARTHPAYFAEADTDPSFERERWGVRFEQDNAVGVLSKAILERIARDGGVPDVDVALEQMRDAGTIEVGEEGRFQALRYVKGLDNVSKRQRLYVFLP